MKFRTAALALAACSLVLTACGGDTDAPEKKAAEAGPSLDDAKSIVLAYFEKSFSADAAACDHESEAYATLLNEENGVETCAERVEALKPLLTDGEPLMDISKTTVEVSAGESGAAVAVVTHEIEGFGGSYALVIADGVWVLDGDVEEPSAGEDGSFTKPKEVSEDEALAIAKAFCGVEVGSTRAEVEGLMGAPTEEGVDEDGQTELGWYLNQDSYTVWFDDSDKVTASSGSSPREGDPCTA